MRRLQIGFLTEWQLYAQQIEGDSWRGGRLDRGKVDKMSGMYLYPNCVWMGLTAGRRATRSTV
jgi:hypothetical protein